MTRIRYVGLVVLLFILVYSFGYTSPISHGGLSIPGDGAVQVVRKKATVNAFWPADALYVFLGEDYQVNPGGVASCLNRGTGKDAAWTQIYETRKIPKVDDCWDGTDYDAASYSPTIGRGLRSSNNHDIGIGSSAVTVFAYILPRAASTSAVIGSRPNPSTVGRFLFGTGNSIGGGWYGLAWWNNSLTGIYSGTAYPTSSDWTVAAWRFIPSTSVHAFKNGVSVGTGTTNINATFCNESSATSYVGLGGESDYAILAGYHFNCTLRTKMDSLYVFNRAFSDAEILAFSQLITQERAR